VKNECRLGRQSLSRPFGGRSMLRLLAVLAVITIPADAQGGAPGQVTQAPTARGAAPFDLTGYWVSVISQNWRLRMVTPPKGYYMGIPMTPAAKQVADQWDPEKTEASGNECKGYGAALIMTLPGRLRVTWQDDSTLRIDIDAGRQTRQFQFGNPKSTEGRTTLQGESVAAWVPRRGPGVPPSTPAARYLKVTTTHMLPGYLRKNGVPYSGNAVLTEYYDLIHEPDGEQWMIVTSKVEDPVYLEDPLILDAQFKRQSDSSGWDPTPCSVK
jgi:hypothetical protein